MKTTLLLLASCATALAATPAQAAIVSLNYDLTGSNFLQTFAQGGATPTPAPVDPVKLNFTLTFDTSVSTRDGVTEGLIVNSFNLPYALRYTYIADSDELIVGTEPVPYGACVTFDSSSNEFCTTIENASKPDAFVFYDDYSKTYLLSLGTPQGQWEARQAALVVTAAAAVPEPASWALMVLGIGLAGAGLRRRRVSVRFATA